MGMHLLGGRGNYSASRREYINSLKYQEILEENLWPVLARHFPRNGYFFQDDNAPVNRSRSTQEFMVRNHINCQSCPAQSPDLNMIENVWLYIKKLQSCSWAVKSKADLIEEIGGSGPESRLFTFRA